MAAEPSFSNNTALASNPVVVIGPQYCCPHPVDLAIVKKVKILRPSNFVVTDTNGNVLLEVKGILTFFHEHRILLDGAGNPIATLRNKPGSFHRRWQVFRGGSTETKDLIFSAKTSSMFNLKNKLDVFLANNTKEEAPDFKVKANWNVSSCKIYAGDSGDSSTIIAQMQKKHTVQSILIGKDKFMVTVYPNIDYAFIAALIVILHEIDRASSNSSSTGGGG